MGDRGWVTYTLSAWEYEPWEASDDGRPPREDWED